MPEQITHLDLENNSADTEKVKKFFEHYNPSIINFEEKSANYLILDNFLKLSNTSKEDI